MRDKLQKYLFELIQVAVGTRSSLSSPSTCSGQAPLSADEWASLRLEFKKQGMLGIGYCGITRLPQEQSPPIQILAQWVHNAEKIRKKNERLSAECASICETLEHDGIRCCVLKGQSNLVNYRPSGWDPYQNQDKNPSKNEEGDSLGGRRELLKILQKIQQKIRRKIFLSQSQRTASMQFISWFISLGTCLRKGLG